MSEEQRSMADPKAPEPNSEGEQSFVVGYGKPPVQSRFKPGQSGNPKGKKKGHRDYKSTVRSVLTEKVTVRTSAGSKKITKLEAVLRTAMNKALGGDLKAMEQMLRIAKELGMADQLAESVNAASTVALMEEDLAILGRTIDGTNNNGRVE